MAGCGTLNPVNHFLQSAPRVFTLQLTWESHTEQPADIAATLAAIDEQVGLQLCRPSMLWAGPPADGAVARRQVNGSSSGAGGSALPTHSLHACI